MGQNTSLSAEFEKSCDSVAMEVLIDFGMPMKLSSVIKMCSKETCNKVRTDKNLSQIFPVQNDLKF
jgi:hypothetical protein